MRSCARGVGACVALPARSAAAMVAGGRTTHGRVGAPHRAGRHGEGCRCVAVARGTRVLPLLTPLRAGLGARELEAQQVCARFAAPPRASLGDGSVAPPVRSSWRASGGSSSTSGRVRARSRATRVSSTQCASPPTSPAAAESRLRVLEAAVAALSSAHPTASSAVAAAASGSDGPQAALPSTSSPPLRDERSRRCCRRLARALRQRALRDVQLRVLAARAVAAIAAERGACERGARMGCRSRSPRRRRRRYRRHLARRPARLASPPPRLCGTSASVLLPPLSPPLAPPQPVCSTRHCRHRCRHRPLLACPPDHRGAARRRRSGGATADGARHLHHAAARWSQPLSALRRAWAGRAGCVAAASHAVRRCEGDPPVDFGGGSSSRVRFQRRRIRRQRVRAVARRPWR